MTQPKIAYFSMEIAVEPGIPTYSGGLGVLAGDTIRSAADLSVPLVAVTLLHRKGYCYQRVDETGWQTEEPVEWSPATLLKELRTSRATLEIEGRTVHVRAWQYDVVGSTGFTVPVYFLDTDLDENDQRDRDLTQQLYGGDQQYRLRQEVLLGIGGVRMLRALGYDGLDRFHMNEGHASLLTLELFNEAAERANRPAPEFDDIQVVREQCVFTTHTPVPAGHDQFPLEMARGVLGKTAGLLDLDHFFHADGTLNMTYVGLNCSHYINGVAKRHGEVSRQLFPNYNIRWITNGIHSPTWAAPSFQELFDKSINGWRDHPAALRAAVAIPTDEIREAHVAAKRNLVETANRTLNAGLNLDVFTIGFARRITAYKRPMLLFHDLDRLRAIVDSVGPIQVAFAGKAHPQDFGGKEILKQIFAAAKELKPHVNFCFLSNYDMEVARLMVAGVDVWLNTPKPPREASGTSGMKAALNGVPSISILDGWWIEGCVEGLTGWSIGRPPRDANDMESDDNDSDDANSLYDKLEKAVLPTYYFDGNRFGDMMRHCIALNASYFNTHRMIREYALSAYLT